MQFLNPSYLWALFGLLVPIAIHLWSKKQGRTIKVGSIKFLKASDTQKSRRLHLNEFYLLFLRILILGLLVFIITEFNWKKTPKNTPLTYIVEASLLNSPEVKTLADAWLENAEVRLLETDFPEYQGEIKDNENELVPHYWQLAKEMQFLPTDSIVVVTKSLLKGIKGKRPQISKNIKWIVNDIDRQIEKPIAELQKTEGVEIISVSSDANQLKFKRRHNSLSSIGDENIKRIEKDTIAIYLYVEPEFEAEERYISASLKALKTFLDYPIQLKSVENTNSLNLTDNDVLVWLSEKPISNMKAKVLQFKADKFAETLISRANSAQTYHLTQRLNSENSISEHLAEQLLSILDPYPEIDSIAQMHDFRGLSLEALQPEFNQEISDRPEKVAESSTLYLWIILIGLLIFERLIARYRKQ